MKKLRIPLLIDMSHVLPGFDEVQQPVCPHLPQSSPRQTTNQRQPGDDVTPYQLSRVLMWPPRAVGE